MTIDLARYELGDRDDVQRLAADVGEQFVSLLGPVVALIDPSLRGIFLSCAIAVPVGALFATLGSEKASFVLDALKEQGPRVLEEHARRLN